MPAVSRGISAISAGGTNASTGRPRSTAAHAAPTVRAPRPAGRRRAEPSARRAGTRAARSRRDRVERRRAAAVGRVVPPLEARWALLGESAARLHEVVLRPVLAQRLGEADELR